MKLVTAPGSGFIVVWQRCRESLQLSPIGLTDLRHFQRVSESPSG
jgi:hypothetical protein